MITTLQIDESTIVASSASGFTSSYIPVNLLDQPPICNLPADLPISFKPLPLTPMNQVCKFTFPNIITPPPIFIPKVAIPTSCTTFNGAVEVVTSSSSSQIAITGASSTINAPAPGCGFTSIIELALSAPKFCSQFTTGGSITFVGSDQIAIGGGITLTPSSVPDCGATLGGTIRLTHPDFCSSFAASSNITFTGTGDASVHGDIKLQPTQPPACGFTIGGNIAIDVPTSCKSMNFTTNLGFSSNNTLHFLVMPSSVQPIASSTGCGGNLAGNLLFDVSPSLLGLTSITLCSGAGNTGTTTVVATLDLDHNTTLSKVTPPLLPEPAKITDCLCTQKVTICDPTSGQTKSLDVYVDCASL
jgi:hypothetical protein